MSFETAKGNMNEIEGKLKAKWGKLTDDDFTFIKGSAQNLAGKLQERYGMLKDKAENEANEFFKSVNSSNEDGDSVQEQLTKTAETVKDNINEASEKLVEYVKSKPIASVAIAFTAGIALALIGRR